MATTRQPLKPITDPVSPVHRLRLTVAGRGFLWHYILVEDDQPAEIQPLPGMSTRGLDKWTAMIYATGKAIEEVGITANFCDFTVKAAATTATIEVLAIEGVNILVDCTGTQFRGSEPFYRHAIEADLPLAIAQELAATIRGMNWEPCDRYVAANGRGYRWGSKPRPRPPQPPTQGQTMTEQPTPQPAPTAAEREAARRKSDWFSTPTRPQGQTMTEQPTPPAPTAAELEAARRIAEALCLIPPQSLAEEVGKLIIAQKSLGDQFVELKRDHIATLDTLGSHVRPMITDLAKRFADIDGTLLKLRRDINTALDRLGFQPFQPAAPAPIPDTPDGPPMT